MSTSDEDDRNMILASWAGAQRMADGCGYATLNAASAAGQYLELGGGNVARAVAMIPKTGGEFWSRVRSILTELEDRERVAAMRATRATGTR